MLKRMLREVMSEHVYGVGPGSTVAEALEVMQDKRVSCVLVLDRDEPKGIFTERNIVTQVAGGGGLDMGRTIESVMTAPVITTGEDTYIYDAYGILAGNNIRHLVVVDADGKARGVMTQSDVVECIGQEYFVEFQQVSQLMTRAVYSVTPDKPMKQVLEMMHERDISCVVVAEDNKPRGILTERDVARLATRNGELGAMPVSKAMSSPVISVESGVAVFEAVRLMREGSVRRLVVVDEQGNLMGLATQSDLVRGLQRKYVEILRQVIVDKDLELRSASRDLERKTAYLDNILSSSLDMGVIATDNACRILYYNPAAEGMMGYDAETVLGQDCRKIHAKEKVNLGRVDRVMDGVKPGSMHTFTFPRNMNGVERILQGRVTGIFNQQRDLVGFVHLLSDVTEAKRSEEAIKFLAYNDILTGLPNRNAFNERLSLELLKAERKQRRLAYVVVDMDRFKEVNDTLGHYTGDMLLKALARRMKEQVRRSDTLARVGGDEFVLVLPEIRNMTEARAIVEKIIESLREPFIIDDTSLHVTVSFGVSMYPEHGRTGRELLKAADEAMYKAKDAGRSNFTSNVALAVGSP